MTNRISAKLDELPLARRRLALELGISTLGDLAPLIANEERRSIIGGRRATGLSDSTKHVLEQGLAAVEKIKRQGEGVALTDMEAAGLESVIALSDRPALLVRNDDFADGGQPWSALSNVRAAICKRLPRVGRIEVRIGSSVREVATGFLVGNGLVMTNHHVIEAIAVPAKPTDNNPTSWRLRTNLRPQINFKAEYMVDDNSHVFLLSDAPIFTHPNLDLGIMHVEATSLNDPQVGLPAVLPLASEYPEELGQIYLIGYPASDNENKIPSSVMEELFGGIFEVKRLSPGEVATDLRTDGVFAHDCTTLGGNSGSCVVDIKTQLVIGLHFQGSYLKANYAVWIPFVSAYLEERGVQFD